MSYCGNDERSCFTNDGSPGLGTDQKRGKESREPKGSSLSPQQICSPSHPLALVIIFSSLLLSVVSGYIWTRNQNGLQMLLLKMEKLFKFLQAFALNIISCLI